MEPLIIASARKHGIADEDILHAFHHPISYEDLDERRFAEHDPANVRDAAPLHALRDAVTERAATERRIAEAVASAREAGVPWSAIGGMLGTSGEAARKRYGVSTRTA